MAKILLKTNGTILTKNFVSISSAAKFLKISPDTLRNWEKEGKLIPARTHGGARRYSAAELANLKKEIRPFAARKKGLVSISQAAKALRVSPDTLRNWDKKGLIESQRSKGGARRFTRDEIKRLQKELGLKELEVVVDLPKTGHEVPKFAFPWLKITFSAALVIFISTTGWFFISFLDPLERKVNETSKILSEIVKSIEALQQGVLGIQSQSTPPLVNPPSNPPTVSANYDNGVVLASAKAPLVLDDSSGQIRCTSCLTEDSSYISVLTNTDGTLSLTLDNKKATISLSLDHANTWSAFQIFQGSVGIGTDSTSQLFQLNPSSSNPVVMTSSGNVGIGVTSPVNKLEVAGAQTIGIDYAGTYTAPANGLLVQGNVGIGISAPSYRLDVGGGARFACGGAGWDEGPATDCADVAEIYQSDGSVEVGEIVAVGEQTNLVTKSAAAYQKGMIGVRSTSPSLLIGGQITLGGNNNLGSNQIPVALAGRVPVKVSDENGPIQVGDYLTSSSIPGVAMKATKIGPVIGQALEPFDVPDLNAQSVLEDDHLVDIRLKLGRILIFVNVSFADPGNFLTSLSMDDQGNLIIPKIRSNSIILDQSVASVSGQQLTANSSPRSLSEASFAPASTQVAVEADQQLALSTDPEYASAGPNLASGEITSLEDRIKQQESRIEVLEAQINTSSSAQLESSNSAAITFNPESTTSGSDSLNLTAPDVLFATSSATLSTLKVTDTLSSDKLFTAQDGKISGDLSVFGKTTLATTTIAGDLIVDGTLAVSGNSINVIGILYIQNSPLAYQVNFFNGLATIDRFGNLQAQTVTVAGIKVIANKISGSGKISTGTKSVDIENTQVEPDSRILITPNSATNLVLAVTEKSVGEKFTVSVAEITPEDIIFDWFLINESPEKL